jgi:hypothetical protein
VQLTGLESNQRTRDPKSRRPCQQSTGHREPPTGVEPAILALQGRCSGRLSYRGGAGTRRGAVRAAGPSRALCARRDSDPHDLAATDPSSLRVYQFRHERVRASARTRTADPARTKGVLWPAELQRHGCRARTRTSIHGFRGRCPAVRRPGIECGRCESNAHATRFELARSTGCRHSRMVRRQGIEPRSAD